ncbi:DUF1559 family PulG-like putative transporter [Planctomicrobium sp. SH664]|uniref:DUF1559 family PulG-like putative transporter n=1 Tax=Planctomicrobium sp. SH664 TaxID=3448125 RepID=UPI003F5BF414
MLRQSLRHPFPDTRARAAFTLIELLVCVAIISVLISLTLPAVQQSREAARRTQCKNNLRQLALAVHQFEEMHQVIPPSDLCKNWASWAVLVLPYLDQSAAFNHWDLRLQYYVQPEEAGVDAPVFHCPTQTRNGQLKDVGDPLVYPPVRVGPIGWSDYAGVSGTSVISTDGVFRRVLNPATGKTMAFTGIPAATTTLPDWTYQMRFRDLNQDGLSQTLLFGEKSLEAPQADTVVYNGNSTAGYTRSAGEGFGLVRTGDAAPTAPQRFAAPHSNSGHFAFADGRVSPINLEIDSQILTRLARVGDGLPVGEF